MNVPLTTAALLLLTMAMLLLRTFWSTLPYRLRFGLLIVCVFLVLLQGFFSAAKWGTISDKLNILIYWLAVAAYELLVLLFTRMSPKWLTSLSAVILLAPVFAASIVLPLGELFDPATYTKVPMGNHFFYEVKPWNNPGEGNKGVDLIVSYRPPIAPFLRHKVRIIPFNNRECDTNGATAVAFPSTKTVLGRCPRWPAEPAGTVDKVFPL
ncbi:hypothetical protein [Granulicella sp. S190]|uniref:hypothetical protein n=1 Tax=Granulicella sp. S190 TaxID=1747226 RepID=UPI00131C8644|nr:hypothetical protein [Granulicella sp. S190]